VSGPEEAGRPEDGPSSTAPAAGPAAEAPPKAGATGPAQPAGEINGPKGPEPTRYGDWEKGGRVSDF
jgi:hypothetical protein